MGTVFKPFVTRPLPEGAEIVTRAGKPVAVWVDDGGKKRQAPAPVYAACRRRSRGLGVSCRRRRPTQPRACRPG